MLQLFLAKEKKLWFYDSRKNPGDVPKLVEKNLAITEATAK